MSRVLDVYLESYLVGYLQQDKHGQMLFQYALSWLETPRNMPISHSLPLRSEPFSHKECRAFFAGILPEEGKREMIAKNLGISAGNDYAMLEQIGGECAGAVTFVASGSALPLGQYSYRALSEQDLLNILHLLPRRPLMAGDEGVRLSLAGAQDKIAVYIDKNGIALPLGGAPSTHILKPAIERFEGSVYNEAFCMRLAGKLGLNSAPVEIGRVGDLDYLLVERYDRKVALEDKTSLKRLHQEDFCQALGYVSEMKYQSEGGPSLEQCFKLLREVSTAPVLDLQRLLDAVIFNALIGNCDAHGKNFSLLYGGAGVDSMSVRMAPLYDLLCTVFYPELSSKMAMKIGGESLFHNLEPHHFEKLAKDSGLVPSMLVRRTLQLAKAIGVESSRVDIDHPVARQVALLIQQRCERFIERFAPSKAIVLAAVKKEGLVLQLASSELKADKEIVLAAIAQDGTSIGYASRDLQADDEVVLAAIKQKCFAALQFASLKLKDDKELILASVKQSAIAWALASERLRQDPDILAAYEESIRGRHG